MTDTERTELRQLQDRVILKLRRLQLTEDYPIEHDHYGNPVSMQTLRMILLPRLADRFRTFLGESL